jgi:starch-binding outer membrane protein, SusD/RagB family
MIDTMTHLLEKCRPMLAVLATLSVAACTDLTEEPFTAITEANFKPQASDLAALMAPAYTPMRPIWMSWYGMVDWQGETGDMILTPVRPNGWYDGGIYIQNHEHRWNASSPGMANGLWGNAYNGINAVNRVLYQIESGVLTLPADVKTATEAELRAVRAYYYALLLDNFGNVPIVTDFTSTELPEQATRQQVYDFVVKEFTEVIPQLSNVVSAATYGRMNQFAAKGVLARLYLNAEVYTGTAQWDKVVQLTDDIINSGKFSLDAAYRTPFSRTNNTASKEIVFAVPYDAVYGNQSNFHMKTLKPDLRFALQLNAQPWGGSAANPQFIDTYDPDDGRLKDSWLMGPQFDGQGRGYNFVKHVPNMTKTEFNNGFPVWKYEIYQGETGSSDVDFPDVRYAEVLMMKAEALLRKGDAGGAAVLVSQVRARNFKGTAASKATVTGADLLKGSAYNYGWYDEDGIVKTAKGGTPVTNGGADVRFGRFLDELRWEFAAEAKDRQMLIRFGVFTTKTWFNHTPNGATRTLFAIPQQRLNTNSKLKQNPGY